MDKLSSIIAAIDAGKLPTQQQINNYVDYTLSHIVAPLEADDSSKLSEPGRILAHDLRELLLPYKQLGTNKNNDNLLQEILWHLQECNFSDVRLEVMDVEEATADLDAFRNAIRTLIKILWTNISGEGNILLNDLASFTRLVVADLAEAVESHAAHAKQVVREFDTQVQQGEKDNLGRKRKSPEEIEQEDAKAKFEKTMDTVKGTGSTVIGTAQVAQETAKETSERAASRLREAYFRMIERAQSDPEYKRALSTLFDMISKWADKTVDSAVDLDHAARLETFVEDPTEEKHLHQAFCDLRTLIERLAEGRSLENLFANLRFCALDAKQDPDIKGWFSDFLTYARQCLQEPGFVRTDEASQEYEDLKKRWNDLLNEESDVAHKWKEDVRGLRHELCVFRQAISRDPDIIRLRRAHTKLHNDLVRFGADAGEAGLQFALEQGSWFWQDIFNVYTPRVLSVLKDIPIPRTEYVDPEVEFVLENLDISSLHLLPGHVYIRNITDVDITAPAEGTTHTAWGTLTHIRMQALQLTLKEVSFYYKDKTATIGPSDFTGIMEFNLPTQGLDVDIKFRLIPNTPSGFKEREHRGRFFIVERVDVSLAQDITFEVKRSNHPILASVFKPVLVLRFREALERTLEEQIKALFDLADGLAFDVSKRAEVFEDTGLGSGPAITAAIWSEIGRLRRLEGGLLAGWKATGTGIIKEGLPGEAKLAMGAEPQILPGEKKGPLGTQSVPVAESPEAQGIAETSRSVAADVKQTTQEAVKEVKSFQKAVRKKTEGERRRPGWQSHAFDFVA
ncbi:hypothetical protein V8B97DRAFT_1176036 [Scleroderma yunnanense]